MRTPLIIRITNNDDFRIIFAITDCADLENAIQHAWQKIAAVRPQHFFHSKEIQQEISADSTFEDIFSPERNYLRQILIGRAIQDRKIIPSSLVIHAFNRHAYGMSIDAAAAVQTQLSGRAPSPWIISGGYLAGEGDSEIPADQELEATRYKNNIPRMLAQLVQADEHAAFLVKVNNLRKQALANVRPTDYPALT